MLHTKADSLWGRPCLAYHVQPDLQPDTRAALEGVQRAVAEHWPAPLHLCPQHGLHITIYALVPVPVEFDKEGYWKTIAEPADALLRRFCTGHGPLDLHFSRVKVTDTAIIAVAQDGTGLIEMIRHQIAELIPPPPGHEPLRYDLIHSTLARHRSTAAIPATSVERVESFPVSVVARVARLKIIRETLFPCLRVDEIASFPLG